MALDKIKPLKIESTDTGGDEDDEFPTSLNPEEDHVECAGIVLDDPGLVDESTVIWRDINDMKLKDTNNPGGYTLTQLALNTSDLINLYLIGEPPTPSVNYTNTYTGNRVDQEQWKRNSDNSLLKQIDYTYTGGRVTKEVRKVYAADGITVLGQITIDYAYTGQHLTGETITRDV